MTGSSCTVALCKNNERKSRLTGKKVGFFSFPKNNKIRQEWIKRCYRKDKFNPEKRKICGRHFIPEDFEDGLSARLLNKTPRRLKNNAVPSLFLRPEQYNTSISAVGEECALIKRQKELVQEILNENELRSSTLNDLNISFLQSNEDTIHSFSDLNGLDECEILLEENKDVEDEAADNNSTTAFTIDEPDDTTKTRCFVCDKLLQDCDFGLFSRADVAKIISKLLGGVSDNYIMVIKEEDYLCRACQELVTRISQLESELRTMTLALRALLRLKYSLDFVNVTPEEFENEQPDTSSQSWQQPSKKLSDFYSVKGSQKIARKTVNTTSAADDFMKILMRPKKPLEEQVIPYTIHYIQSAVECETTGECDLAIDTRPVEVDLPEKRQDDSLQQCGTALRKLLTNFGNDEIVETEEITAVVNEEVVESLGTDHLMNEKCKKSSENEIRKVYKCGMCNFKSTSPEEVRAHFLAFKNKKGYYCSICDFGFHKTNQYLRHAVNHSKVDQKRCCVYCNQKFHDRLHMKFHIQEKHKKDSFSHTCPKCNKVFLFARSLRWHIIRIHEKQPILTCHVCNMRFYDKIKYRKHTEYFHRSSLNCKFCDKPCVSIEKLFMHEYRHKRACIPHYQCSYCRRRYARRMKLLIHEEQHYGIFTHRCEVCSLGFNELESFERHKACSHKVRSYNREVCDVCGKTYANLQTYLSHRLLHDNPHPFECHICLKKFRYKNRLYKHKKHFHPVA